MIDVSELAPLVHRLQSEKVQMFECSGPDGLLLRLCFAQHAKGDPAADQHAAMPAEDTSTPLQDAPSLLKSLSMGRFSRGHPLSGWQAHQEGACVQQDEIVAFLRIGEALLPVRFDRDAILGKQLARDGALVGYGDSLFELR